MLVSGPMLSEKAVDLSKTLYGEAAAFTGSYGWRWHFCKRHQLSLQGEKLSTDEDAAIHFVPSFQKFVREKKYSMDQIFNADETGLYFRLLPDQTLAASFEKSADGRKKAKERVTLNVCSNVSGSIELPLHLIGKAKRPRCFKGINLELLPVKYSAQKNAWMDSSIYHDWFQKTFVPHVRKKLTTLGQECKAFLLLDNCSAHPDTSELVSDDGEIIAKFLPPNATSLIQPMDQGVLQAVKKRYKKKLLRKLIVQDDRGVSIKDFLKSVTMKTVSELVAEAWEEIQPSTLRKSWQKILPIRNPPKLPKEYLSGTLSELFKLACEEDEEPLPPLQKSSKTAGGYAFWQGIRVRLGLHHDDRTETPPVVPENLDDCQIMFRKLGHEIGEQAISEWLNNDPINCGTQSYYLRYG